MNRATVTCGCGATASFEDESSVPIQINVDAFNKAHESCRIARRDYRPGDASEVRRLRTALEKIASTPCGPECGCCGMDGLTAAEALQAPRKADG